MKKQKNVSVQVKHQEFHDAKQSNFKDAIQAQHSCGTGLISSTLRDWRLVAVHAFNSNPPPGIHPPRISADLHKAGTTATQAVHGAKGKMRSLLPQWNCDGLKRKFRTGTIPAHKVNTLERQPADSERAALATNLEICKPQPWSLLTALIRRRIPAGPVTCSICCLRLHVKGCQTGQEETHHGQRRHRR
eukprot:6100144-Amphidinium_carterae.2